MKKSHSYSSNLSAQFGDIYRYSSEIWQPIYAKRALLIQLSQCGSICTSWTVLGVTEFGCIIQLDVEHMNDSGMSYHGCIESSDMAEREAKCTMYNNAERCMYFCYEQSCNVLPPVDAHEAPRV